MNVKVVGVEFGTNEGVTDIEPNPSGEAVTAKVVEMTGSASAEVLTESVSSEDAIGGFVTPDTATLSESPALTLAGSTMLAVAPEFDTTGATDTVPLPEASVRSVIE